MRRMVMLLVSLLFAAPALAQSHAAMIVWTRTSPTVDASLQRGALQQTMNGLSDLLARDSYGKQTIAWTVYGPYIGHAEVDCSNPTAMQALAVADGLSSGGQVVYLGPDCASVYREGTGDLPFISAMFRHFRGELEGSGTSSGTVCHSGSGAFVTFPAPGVACTFDNQLQFGPNGWSYENDYSRPAFVKLQRGWIGASDLPTVPASNATYQLSALEAPLGDGLPKGLTFAVNGQRYDVEYRSMFGIVLYQGKAMLDASPDGLFGMNGGGSPGLQPGQSIYDAANQVLFTAGANGAITLAFGPQGCVKQPPTLTLAPSTANGVPGGILNYSLTVTNTDTAVCPATTFAPVAFTLTGETTVTLPPGGTATLPLTAAAGATPAGTYQISVVYADATDVNHAGMSNATASLVPSAVQATFLKTDLKTRGHWHGVYGTEGSLIPDDTTGVLPAWARVTVTPGSGNISRYYGLVFDGGIQPYWDWGYPQLGNDPTQMILSGWMAGAVVTSACSGPGAPGCTVASFTIDVNVSDTVAHAVSLYAYRGHGCNNFNPHTERVTVVDASQPTVTLDTRTLTFDDGMWLQWAVRGHVQFLIDMPTCEMVDVTGVFFDPAK